MDSLPITEVYHCWSGPRLPSVCIKKKRSSLSSLPKNTLHYLRTHSMVLQKWVFLKEGKVQIFTPTHKFTSLLQGTFPARSFKSLPKSRGADLTANYWWAASPRRVLWGQAAFTPAAPSTANTLGPCLLQMAREGSQNFQSFCIGCVQILLS